MKRGTALIYYPLLKNTVIECSERLVTLETFYQSDLTEKYLPTYIPTHPPTYPPTYHEVNEVNEDNDDNGDNEDYGDTKDNNDNEDNEDSEDNGIMRKNEYN